MSGIRGVGLCHAEHDFFGHGDAEVILHELGVTQAGEWPDAGNDGDAEALDALEKILEQAKVKDGLCDGELGASLDLVLEAAEFVLDIRRAGIGGDADGEVGGSADRVSPDVEAVVKALHKVDEADGVDIEDSGSVRIVSKLGRVACDAEEVVQADGRGAEQVRLNAEDVAVAACVVKNGLNAGVLLNLDAEALATHASRCARRIGNMDGVDAEAGEQARAFDFL